MKRNLYLIGFVAIFAGIFLGNFVNKWLGYGVITAGMAFAIICIQKMK